MGGGVYYELGPSATLTNCILWGDTPDEIERTFGHSSNLGVAFNGLPAWARRQHRVERWMWGKVLLYHAYLATKPHAA
jgi:hypothetical protein